MSETNDEVELTPEQYLAKLNELLISKQEEWNKTLPPLLKRLNGDPDSLPDTQAELLSYRHMICDELSAMSRRLAKHNRRIRVLRRDKFAFYSTGVMPDGSRPNGKVSVREVMMAGLKTSKGEKDLIIAGDLTDFEAAIEAVESHLQFLRDALKSVDHALYAVKNRIELLNILLGIK